MKTRPTPTDLDKLNELIDWYNRNKPTAGQLIRVKFPIKQLQKFAHPVEGEPNHWHYRGRILASIGDQHGNR